MTLHVPKGNVVGQDAVMQFSRFRADIQRQQTVDGRGVADSETFRRLLREAAQKKTQAA